MTEEVTIPQELINELAMQFFFNRRIHPPVARWESGGRVCWREDIIEWKDMSQPQKADWINKANRFLIAWFAKFPDHKEFVLTNWHSVYK